MDTLSCVAAMHADIFHAIRIYNYWPFVFAASLVAGPVGALAHSIAIGRHFILVRDRFVFFTIRFYLRCVGRFPFHRSPNERSSSSKKNAKLKNAFNSMSVCNSSHFFLHRSQSHSIVVILFSAAAIASPSPRMGHLAESHTERLSTPSLPLFGFTVRAFRIQG